MSDHDCAAVDAELASVRAELDRIQFTLDVMGTVDLDSGLLNRNGIFESIQRAQRWLVRRGDIYGALYVSFPDLADADDSPEEHLEMIKHLAATIGAGVRDVDEVGRAEENAFCAVLADLEAGALHIVADRVTELVSTVTASNPAAGGEFQIGGVEVLTASHTYGTVLDTARRLALSGSPGVPNLSTI